MNIDLFKGKLIVCEGADHTGKTTVAEMMTDELNEQGVQTIFTFQPGDTAFGKHAEITRDFCTKKTYNLDALSNFFAFLLDRSENTIKIVKPALEAGVAVIADRWLYSTISYQFYGKNLKDKYNLNLKFFSWMNELASHYLKPDIALYFMRDVEAVKAHEDDDKDIFETEKEAFKKRVKDAYELMVQVDPIFKIIEVHENATVTLSRAIQTSYEYFQTL